MLPVPEVASRLGRSPETVRRWIRAGRLKARKVGTQHMIEEAELAAFSGDDEVSMPSAWRETATGEPMPDVVSAIRRSRVGH